jgi:hypothetical protein
MPCQSCGRSVPTILVRFIRHIGLLALYTQRRYTGELCYECSARYFWQTTLVTSTLGWLGIVSALLTPLVLVINVVQFRRACALHHTIAPTSISSNAVPLTCPLCQSSQIGRRRPDDTMIASMIGGLILLIWGVLIVNAALSKAPLPLFDLIVGLIFVGVAGFALCASVMVLRHQPWRCRQCQHAWLPYAPAMVLDMFTTTTPVEIEEVMDIPFQHAATSPTRWIRKVLLPSLIGFVLICVAIVIIYNIVRLVP